MNHTNIQRGFLLAMAILVFLPAITPVMLSNDALQTSQIVYDTSYKNTKKHLHEINWHDTLKDPYEIYEEETLMVTITTGWNPPQPNTQICLWVIPSTLPHGAIVTPECHCSFGEVTCSLEWTPSIGQAGVYDVFFEAGASCGEPLSSFFITIIVYALTEEPPTVSITSPANNSIVLHPDITVVGEITDDTGVISIGAHHEWNGGDTISSGTIHPPEPYYPFSWEFTLHEGWNKITIFTEDQQGLYAEDSVEILYNMEQIAQFNQLDYYLDDVVTLNSDWGMMHLTFVGFTGVQYLNLIINGLWAIQNLPIQSIEGTMQIQTQSFGFPLGIQTGYDIREMSYGLQLSNSVLNHPPLMTDTAIIGDEDYRIYNGGVDVNMHTQPTTAHPVIGGNTTATEHKHEHFPNQEAENYTCAPTAVSNSLKFLKNKHDLTVSDENISIVKMKEACNWGEKKDSSGNVIGTGCWIDHDDTRPDGEKNAWWEDKKEYMNTNNISVTTRQLPANKIDDIAGEIDKGQDIEAELGGHTVSVVGIKDLGNGNYSVTIAHDKNQSEPGGCITETGVWNTNTSSWSGALAGYTLNYFVIECPKHQNNPPDAPQQAAGPTSGTTGNPYTYSTATSDPEQDDVFYYFNWGDGTRSNWLGPYPSGQNIQATHSWISEGTYQITIIAKDIWGAISTVSPGLSVVIQVQSGDMNGDGRLNAADVRYLAMYLNGHPDYHPLHDEGDVNSDGRLNAADVRYLAMYLNGHPDYTPLYP